MIVPCNDVKQIKSRLNRYRETEKEIYNQTERLEYLKSKIYSISSPQITDMPKGSPSAINKSMDKVVQKEDLEELVKDLINKQAEERRWIEHMLESLDKADERAVIRLRYIDGIDWPEISELLYGDKYNYIEKIDSYYRRVTRLHCRAICNMSKVDKQDEKRLRQE